MSRRAGVVKRRSSEIIESVFSSAHVYLALVDRDLNYIRVSRAYADALGRRHKCIAGVSHFDFWPRGESEAVFRQALSNGETATIFGARLHGVDRSQDGTTLWDYTLEPLKDSNGKVDEILLTFLNVTRTRCCQPVRQTSAVMNGILQGAETPDEHAGAVGPSREISLHERSNEAFPEEHSLGAAAIEQAAVGLCVFHTTVEPPFLHCTVWNRQMIEITGYTVEEINRRGWYRSLCPDEETCLRAGQRMAELRGGKDLRNEEWHILRADGSKRILTISTSTLETGGGPIDILALVHDVTERVQEEALLKIQKELALALGSTSDLKGTCDLLLSAALQLEGIDSGGIYLVDNKSGELRLVSHEGLSDWFIESVSHYTSDTPQAALVMGGNCTYLPNPRELQPLSSLVEAEGIRALVITPVKYGDRVVAALNLASHSASEISPRTLRAIETIAAQIGGNVARVQTEEALRESEEQLRKNKNTLQAVFEGISDPLILVDAGMCVLMLNRAARRLYEVPETYEFPGQSPCYQILRGRKAPCEDCDIQHRIRSGEHYSFERKGLEEPDRLEQVTVFPVKEKEESTKAAVLHIRDVTDTKKLERELIHADKMISLGVLVSGVAHEINNPNNFIMLNAPLLQELWEDIAPILDKHHAESGDFRVAGLPYHEMRDEVPGLISGILEGSRRINRIVQDLKGFARQGSADLNQTVDVNEVIKRAVSLAGNMIRKTTDEFSLECGESLPSIRGNAQKLEQVVLNLIQNACQALPNKARAIRLSSRHDENSGHVVIAVEDEGVGIPEDILPRVMDPFFTTKRSYGGTGLGLSVSSNIVKEHGGQMEIHSRRGRGSTFTVLLPTSVPPVPMPRILVADDDEAVRTVFVEMLKGSRRYHVQEASSGAEACIKIGNDRPDLLILDIRMPDMNGVEVARLIKEKPELSAMKVIVVTGFPDSPELAEVRKMGYENVLVKPVGLEELLNRVDAVLGNALSA